MSTSPATVESNSSLVDLCTRVDKLESQLALLTNTDVINQVEPVQCFADMLTVKGERVTLARVNIPSACEVTIRDAEITRLIACMIAANVKTTNMNIIALGVGATSLYNYRKRHNLIKRHLKRPRTDEDVEVEQPVDYQEL